MQAQVKPVSERLKEVFLHRLFILDNQKIKNPYAVALSDILQLSSLLFYFLNPNLELNGPLLKLYLQQVQPYMILSYDSGSQPYIPAIVFSINFLFFLLIVFFLSDILESILVTFVEVYLFLIPIFFVDQIIAVLNIQFLTGTGLILGWLAIPITIVMVIMGLHLHNKLYRFYEIIFIAAIKFGAGKWTILGFLIFKSIVEYFWFRHNLTMAKNFQVLANIFLTVSHLITEASGSVNVSNDILFFAGLVLVIFACLLTESKHPQNMLQAIEKCDFGAEANITELLQVLQKHVLNCNDTDCPCSSISQIDPGSEQQIRALATKIAMQQHTKKLSETKDYFAFAEFCINQLKGNLKGLSLMINIRPKSIFQQYRYMSICIKYEIQAKSQRSTGKVFQLKSKQIRNFEEELSKFRQRILELVKYLYNFWLEIKEKALEDSYLQSIVQVSKQISRIEDEYKRLCRQYDDSVELQTIFKIFRQRITHQQSYNHNQKIVIPSIPPFVLSRNHRIVKLNQQFYQMFGWSSDQLIDKPIQTIMPSFFHEFHPQWVSDFIENYDIKTGGVKEGLKIVKCKSGLIRIASAKFQVLPRFQQGIEILTFLVPKDNDLKSQFQPGYILADLTTSKILQLDLNIFKLLKIQGASCKYTSIAQQIQLHQLIPLFFQGQSRLIQSMKLSSTNSVSVTFRLKPILDLLLIKTNQISLAEELQISFITFSGKQEISNIKLLKCSKDHHQEEKNDYILTTKSLYDHINFKQTSLQAHEQKFTLPYILLIGPLVVFFLGFFVIQGSEKLTQLINSGYIFLATLLDQCLNVVRQNIFNIQIAQQFHSEELYSNWLEFKFGDPSLFNTVSRFLRGQITDGNLTLFKQQIIRGPMKSQCLFIQKAIKQSFDFADKLQSACLGFVCAYIIYTLIDFLFNIKYILKIKVKIRQTIAILKLIDSDEINRILIDLYTFKEAFCKEAEEEQGSQLLIQDLQEETIGIVDTSSQECSRQILKKKKKRSSSRVSIETMSILFYAQSMSHDIKSHNSKRGILAQKRKSKQHRKNQKSNLSNISNMVSFESPTPFGLLSQIIPASQSPLNVSGMVSQKIVGDASQYSQQQIVQDQKALETYSKTSLSIVLMAIATFVFIGFFIGFYVALIRMSSNLRIASQAQNLINKQFSTLQQQALYTYLQINTETQKNLDILMNQEQKIMNTLSGLFDNSKNLWSNSNDGNLCQMYHEQTLQCETTQNGLFKMGQSIVLGNFVQNTRRLQNLGSQVDGQSSSFISLETTLKYQAYFCSKFMKVFYEQIIAITTEYKRITYILAAIDILFTIAFLVTSHQILSIYREKVTQTKKLLQIIPCEIVNNNQKIQKQLTQKPVETKL